MSRVVVFDLGDVVCRFTPEARTERLVELTGQPPQAIRDAVWESGLDRRAECGALGPHEIYDELRQAVDTTAGDEQLREAWSRAFQPDLEVLDVVVATSGPRVLFTNNGPILSDCLTVELRSVADCFDECVCSWQLGHRKPEPAASSALMARLSVAPADVVFIDDRTANVSAAMEVGIDAIRFSSAAALRASLDERRLL